MSKPIQNNNLPCCDYGFIEGNEETGLIRYDPVGIVTSIG